MLRSTIFLVKGMREFTRGGYERASRSFDNDVMQVNKCVASMDYRSMAGTARHSPSVPSALAPRFKLGAM